MGSRTAPARTPLAGHAPAGSWQVSAQPVAASTRLWLLLPPGASHLALATSAAPNPGGRGPISIVVSALGIAP